MINAIKNLTVQLKFQREHSPCRGPLSEWATVRSRQTANVLLSAVITFDNSKISVFLSNKNCTTVDFRSFSVV